MEKTLRQWIIQNIIFADILKEYSLGIYGAIAILPKNFENVYKDNHSKRLVKFVKNWNRIRF